MPLLAQIRADALTARKARESAKALFLVTLLGEVERVGKDAGNRDTTDAETLAVIKKFSKNLREVLVHRPGDAHALAETAWLADYVPTGLSGAALDAAIAAVVTELGLSTVTGKDVGAIMKGLAARHGGAYDGQEASGKVRALVG